MKKTILLFSIILVAFATNSQTLIRVNSNPGVAADYTTLQDAHDGATAGDIIYLEHSSISYGACTFTKQLTIIGTGYYLNENSETPVQKAVATVGNLVFNSGSEGTIITGLSTGTITINVNNIAVRRNITDAIYLGTVAGVSNCLIEQSSVFNVIDQNACSNTIIKNSIVRTKIIMYSSSSATITNNIININEQTSGSGGASNIYNSTFYNNIIFTNDINGTGNDSQYNIFEVAGTDANGNQYNIDMSTVFVGTGSTDGQWQLATGSPALDAANDGGECGIFGGSSPYRLSGLPAVPYIYDATVPTSGSASGGLPVQIKIKSNN